jgi:hypothetical protein
MYDETMKIGKGKTVKRTAGATLNWRMTTIRMPEPLVKRARMYAVETDTTFQALVIEAVEGYLKARGK